MNKALEKLAHLILYFGLVVGVVAVFLARFDSGRQFLIVLILIAYYLIWGFSYHNWRGDLRPRIILEYLAISLVTLLVAIVVFMS